MVLINCIDSCMTASAVFVDHQHFCTKRGGTPIQYSQQLLLWDEVRIANYSRDYCRENSSKEQLR